jgi:hypothetical protein
LTALIVEALGGNSNLKQRGSLAGATVPSSCQPYASDT